uniref:Uncharacterized protein n=2 Tax=Palpitomonas bilix TaxID=652834 RepID=A0A7S3G902_9EUKA|mmetsp:Transcript_36125/g.93963  ORF Transcript_36125/g.93963 Transcript_36125/m.93963 type:complete len:232 (+) Transcript_36125:74-769(+)
MICFAFLCVLAEGRGRCAYFLFPLTSRVSGGIGPTHDDVTYEAIALATDTELKLDEMTAKQMEKMSRKKYGEGWEMNEWRRKMAVLPTPSHIQRVEGLWCPVVTAYLQAEAGKGAGVTALPGVPPLFDKMLSAAISERDGVFHPMVKASRVVASVFTQMTEGDIAALLTECQNNVAKKGIMIGSYPAFNMAEGMMDYRVKVSIEGDEKEDVEDVAFWLAQRLDGRMTIGDK